MKKLLSLLFVLGLALSACGTSPTQSALPAQSSTPSQVPSATQTLIPPTSTVTPLPTIPTLMSLPTLNSDQAKETIQALLKESADCLAPCFWGITPSKTTLEEAKQNLAHLGIRPQYTNTLDNKEYYDSSYTFDYGLSISLLLATKDGVVQNLVVNITPELQQTGVPRGWLAYSPETLIARYGIPSQAGIVVDTGPRTFFAMDIYFDKFDLVIQYAGYGLVASDTRICPLIEQFESVRVWLGKNPENPPGKAVPLEEATSLTMEEFSALMADSPEKACFNLKAEAFP
jgi:hypothetical protein